MQIHRRKPQIQRIRIHPLPPQRPEEKWLHPALPVEDLPEEREFLSLKEGIKGNCEDISFPFKYSFLKENLFPFVMA